MLHFQHEKESSAGEAQIRFELRLNDSGERPMGIPGDMLLNMFNVLLLYCRVHGTMTLWVFNAQALSSGFADFLIAKGAMVMADNPAGFNGRTVLTIERKLK